MKLKQLLETFDFDDFFPEVCVMYPNARRHKREFMRAFNMLYAMQPQYTKKAIRYQRMTDPESGNMFFGAQDSCFNAQWETLLGKEVTKDKDVDLDETSIVANCLLNVVFIGKHPQEFEDSYQKLVRG